MNIENNEKSENTE